MLIRRISKLALISAATALTLVLSVGVQNAEARDGARAHSAQRGAPAKRTERPNVPRGDRTVHTERQRTENGHSSHSVVTGSNGQTATRDATVINDRDAGTRTRDVTYTGPNGGTRTVNDVATRTEDGHTRYTVFTDAQGRTATREAVVVNDGDGTRTRDVTYTGRNGGVSTVNDVTQRTEDGYTRSTTVTGPNGNVGAREVTVNCDKAAGKCTKDVTVDGGRDDGN